MRVNISVPDALRARMERVNANATTRINWSAIACRAFEEEIQRRERKADGLSLTPTSIGVTGLPMVLGGTGIS